MAAVKTQQRKKPPLINLQASIPMEYYSKVIELAKSRDLTRSAIAREAIFEYLEKRR